MKIIIFTMLLLISIACFAQSPSPAGAVTGTTVTTLPSSGLVGGLLSPSTVAGIISLVLCLNVALSAIQQMFSNLSKQEPSWLTDVSGIVLKIAKYLGSNPNA